MGLVLLPWLATVCYTAGGWAALNLVAYVILVSAVGYFAITLVLSDAARTKILVLTPAVGILSISALTAFWVRLGIPLMWSVILWFGLMIAGLYGLWRDRSSLAKSTVDYGLTLGIFSVLICAFYFFPTARNDIVLRGDGSFHWSFVDTQHFHAITTSIKNSGSPPKTPGTFTAELLYHFGPYAPAAVISRLDGLDAGDAIARVTRGASLWALVLSCFGLGTLLSLEANGTAYGGIASVAGLFSYGSLLALFTSSSTGSGHLTNAIMFNIPDVAVLGDGGPFDGLLGGHSVLHGLVAITGIMGLCLAGCGSAFIGRSWVLLLLPAFSVAVHPVAALYCLGVVGILLLWGRFRSVESWLEIVLLVCLFVAAWNIMGYRQASDAGLLMMKEHISWQWWSLAVWLVAGLGFRVLGLQWISRPLDHPVSALVLASVVGLLGFYLLVSLRDANEKYGIYFLQGMLSIFTFSRLTSGWWRGAERSRLIMAWLRVATKLMIVLAIMGFMMAVLSLVLHRHTGIAHFAIKIFVVFLVLGLLASLSWLVERGSRYSLAVSTALICVLMIGFFAWSPVWIRYGLGRVKSGITYSPGEVRGLHRLREIMAPNDRFATNQHALDTESLAPPNERSYGYSALSEHSVLLEDMSPEATMHFRGLTDFSTTTTCSSIRKIHKRCSTSHGPGTSDGLSRTPTRIYPCRGPYRRG